MKNAWRAQERQLVELEAKGPRCQMQRARHLHQVGERCALEGDGETSPHAGEVDTMAVEPRHHADARQPALGCLRLQEYGQAPPPPELEVTENLHRESGASGEAQERFEDPFDEAPPIQEDVGLHLHAGLERFRGPVGANRL